MKKLIYSALIVVLSSSFFFWLRLSDFEFGKFDNFQEALKKGIPNKINNIINKEQHDGVTMFLFTTNPDKDDLPYANYEALAVAFFKGNDKDGWVSIGHHGWTHYDNDNMTVYLEPIREFDNEGKVLHEFYVVFGEINNPEIVKLETKTEDELFFKEAKIIMNEGNRYYFQIGRETIVRGLSESGEVIERQGG